MSLDTPYPRGVIIISMTTILGLQHKDIVIIGADSQITEDNFKTISSGTPKIIRRGRYIIGITGDTRPGDILAYNWKPPSFKATDDPIQHMGKKVIPSIIKAFNEGGYKWDEMDEKKDAGFDYLIAFNANLFHIACDMSFIQADNHIYGLGTGGQLAFGYLNGALSKITKNEKHILDRILVESIKFAAEFDVNTGGAIQIEHQIKGE